MAFRGRALRTGRQGPLVVPGLSPVRPLADYALGRLSPDRRTFRGHENLAVDTRSRLAPSAGDQSAWTADGG